MSVDMLSEALKILIEYDGHYYHSGVRSGRSMAYHIGYDTAETQALLDTEYRVVRIRENGLPFMVINTDKVLEIGSVGVVEYAKNGIQNIHLIARDEWKS